MSFLENNHQKNLQLN